MPTNLSPNRGAVAARFNLEANVLVDDAAFAAHVVESLERDLTDATRMTAQMIRALRWQTRTLAWVLTRFRSIL